VFANQQNAGPAQSNRLGAEQSELTVANYGNVMAGFDRNSFHDSAGGR
jgi:hypothetical protein